MVCISGVDLPCDKRVEVALTYIFGVGRTRAVETLAATGVNPDTRVKDLAEDELVALSKSPPSAKPSTSPSSPTATYSALRFRPLFFLLEGEEE